MNNHFTCMHCMALSEMRLSSTFVNKDSGETMIYAACPACGAVHLGSCSDDEIITMKEAPETPEIMVHAFQSFCDAGITPSSGKKLNNEAIDIENYKTIPEIDLSEGVFLESTVKISFWSKLLSFFTRK